jgi:hypothetical protein
MMKNFSFSTKAIHAYRKNFRVLQFLWRMQLHIQYTRVRSNVYVQGELENEANYPNN